MGRAGGWGGCFWEQVGWMRRMRVMAFPVVGNHLGGGGGGGCSGGPLFALRASGPAVVVAVSCGPVLPSHRLPLFPHVPPTTLPLPIAVPAGLSS